MLRSSTNTHNNFPGVGPNLLLPLLKVNINGNDIKLFFKIALNTKKYRLKIVSISTNITSLITLFNALYMYLLGHN